MRVKSYRAEERRLVGTAPERPVLLIKPLDAQRLYESLHTDTVLVLAFNAVWVRRNPMRNPPALRAARKLESFVAHKCVYGLAQDRREVELHFNRFADWRQGTFCRGDNDPRVLPLHVFEARGDWSGLGQAPTDTRFRSRYGNPRSRRDDDEKVWTRSNESHGARPIKVAGCALTPGLHWDVETDSRRATLYGAHEVWELRRGDGYLNVHPNAYVRKSGRSRARRVWKADS